MKRFRLPLRRRARGFTLIEVLVSILIFSFGVLGVVGMQARLLQASTQNGDRSRASLLANELSAKMWMQQSVTFSDYTVTTWQELVKAGLPNGSGSVQYTTSAGVTSAAITVIWRPNSAASAVSANNQYTTTVVIP